MADPKIRYDIEAGIKGEADVEQLAQTLRRLGDTLEGDLKTQANEAANALESLGAKRDAVEAFQKLTNEAGALSIELAEADGKLRSLAAEMPAAASAAQRLALAEGAVRSALDTSTSELTAQRAALATLKTEFTGAARNTDEYREAQATLSARIKELRAEVAAKKAALAGSVSETNAAATAEKKLAAEYATAGTAAVRASDAVKANTGALAASRTSLQAFGVSAENTAESHRRLTAALTDVREKVSGLAPAFAASAAASSSSVQRQIADQRSLSEGVQGVRNQLQAIQTIASVAVGGSFLTGIIKSAAETADEFKNLQARMRLVTGEGPLFESSFRAVADIALATHSPLAETGTLFSKLAKSGTDAGLSIQAASAQALGLTTTINQAIQLSGASADASQAAITQLIQGLQSGVLRGDEFNSVMEQAPRLAQALAEGLGRTTGELRAMAEQGTLTSATVIRALTTQSATVQREFAKLPQTVGRSLQDLSTQWTLYVGAADKGFVSSANLAKVISGLAANLDSLVSVLYAAGKAWAAIKLAGLAADAYRWAAATAVSTTAVTANTTAVVVNTAAQAANAAAARSSAASATAQAAAVVANTSRIGAAGAVLGRFSVLLGPVGIGLAAIAPELVGIGTALGEGIAKWQGYGKAMEQSEEKLRMQSLIATEYAASQAAIAKEMGETVARQKDLSVAAVDLIGKFDGLREKGSSASEAIDSIGKKFDLSTVAGFKTAAGVLDQLLQDAKLTAGQFQAVWADALKGEDLALFETRARAAFAGSAREAARLGAVLDGTAREAIRRAGLDFDLISGGMSKATRSAINDTNAIITNFDALKAKGVDVGQALAASLGKALDTAENQKALDAVIKQIESMRAKLGDKVTDGLLDQAKKKAEELSTALAAATPGIQNVAEAMKNLGITSDKALKDTAAEAKKSYDFLVSSGTASTRELRAAFTKYATDAIASNDGVATSGLAIEAAMRGVQITTDAAGKSMVSALNGVKASADAATGGLVNLGNAALGASAKTVSALEAEIASQQRLNKVKEDGIALENKRRGVDSSGFAANAEGGRIVAGSDLMSLTGIAAFLKNAGIADEAKAREIAKEFADSKGNITYMNNPGQRKYGGDTISVALLRAAERYTFGIGGQAQTPSTIPVPEASRTVNLNLNLNGQSYGSIPTTQAGATALEAMLADLQNGKGRST